MSKPRKLLTPSTLAHLAKLTTVGVPVANAMRQLDLEGKITRPTVVSLLKAYAERHDINQSHSDTTCSSLFPDWLNKTGDAVQEQPENHSYIGYFPQGYWVASDKESDACKT